MHRINLIWPSSNWTDLINPGLGYQPHDIKMIQINKKMKSLTKIIKTHKLCWDRPTLQGGCPYRWKAGTGTNPGPPFWRGWWRNFRHRVFQPCSWVPWQSARPHPPWTIGRSGSWGGRLPRSPCAPCCPPWRWCFAVEWLCKRYLGDDWDGWNDFFDVRCLLTFVVMDDYGW